ncbi:MAG: glycosyltransferase family 4 protein [Bacteroidales bacterium]|nr:glycosyltransferase family 4 protein [Bacteroidales bacterium]
MKVLFVVSSFPDSNNLNSGSFNVRAAKLLNEFCGIKVIRLRSWIPGRKIILEYIFDSFIVTDISLPYLPLKIPGRIIALITGIYKYLSFYILKDVISQYDVIHSVGIDLPGIVCSYWAKRKKKKHIAQIVGTDVNYRLGFINKYPGVKGWEVYINYLVGNSKSLVEEFRNLYPDFPENKTATIYRGVNLTEFKYVMPKNLNSEINFLFIGGISPKDSPKHGKNFKGILTLIEAWDLLTSNYQPNNVSLKLLIGGPNTYNNMLLTEKNKPINGNCAIEVIGSLTSTEVKKYMQTSAVVVIPSMAEGLPNVALEAAAVGRPVIGSRVGGIPEIVIHNETGLLFSAGNIYALTNCMKQLIDNPQLILRFGINARKRVTKHFNSDKFANKYIALYES